MTRSTLALISLFSMFSMLSGGCAISDEPVISAGDADETVGLGGDGGAEAGGGDEGGGGGRQGGFSDVGGSSTGGGDGAGVQGGGADPEAPPGDTNTGGGDEEGDMDGAGAGEAGDGEGQGGSNVGIAPPGAQDFGEFKRALDQGRIPNISSLDATGFINEHKIDLPAPDCGDMICLHGMLGVMGNMINGADCTMLMLGLNAHLSDDQMARKPLNLTVAVDVSGSMRAEGKMEFALRGLQLLLGALHDDDTITLVTYSSSARVVEEAVGQAGWDALSETIGRLSPTGGTNLYDGLELAFEMTQRYQSAETQNRVILLSDGQPTVGITDEPEIRAMAERFTTEGIGLTTIGLGDEFNPQLMRGLAEVGAGNYYFLEDVAAVEEVFVEEIEYFVTPVATNLRIELEAGDAYGMREIFGTSMQETEGDRSVITFPAVSIAHRQSDEDAEHGRRGGGGAMMVELTPHRGWEGLDGIDISEVTTMRLTYTPADSPLSVERETVVEYPFDPGALQDGGFFSVGADEAAGDAASVEKGFVMLNMFVGFRMATERANRGDLDSALVVLQDLETGVADWVGENNDLDILDDHRILLQYINVLRDQGAARPSDDEPVEEPWPRD